MENKDVFMAAYERAEEKNNLRHSVFPRIDGPGVTLVRPAGKIVGDVTIAATKHTVKRATKKLDKKTKKLGKKIMKTGRRALNTVEKAGEWYGKE